MDLNSKIMFIFAAAALALGAVGPSQIH